MKKKDLKKAIKEKEIQLSKLEQHIDKSNTCAEVYNKVILEKAILNKELSDMEKNQNRLICLELSVENKKIENINLDARVSLILSHQ